MGGYGWLQVAMVVTGGYRGCRGVTWVTGVKDGYGWLWVVMGGYGWLQVVMGGHGRVTGVKGGYGSTLNLTLALICCAVFSLYLVAF